MYNLVASRNKIFVNIINSKSVNFWEVSAQPDATRVIYATISGR